MKIVIFPAIDDDRLEAVSTAAGAVPVVNCHSTDEAKQEIKDATGFFGKITPELLALAEELTWVQSPTASLEHYVFPELVEHRCQLSNMRGLFYDVIADHVFGFILCAARNLHRYMRQQIERKWSPIGTELQETTLFNAVGTVSAIDLQHRQLSECTLGVVGVGSIGSEICRRGAAFGMELIGVDPIVKSVSDLQLEVWDLSRLDDLLSRSDFVVIAAPHTPQTEKQFRRAQFQKMKSSAWLINIGRGVIVDLTDLTDSLREQEIAGAALDVFEEEPLPADHPLWGMENVIITPHVAAASPRVAERHLQTLVENVKRHVRGESPSTLVDKVNWF